MASGSPAREVFEACLAVSVDDRDEVLRRNCGGDPELERQVRRLLEAHDRAQSAGLEGTCWSQPAPPTQIGPYRLIRVVGEGGMGVVYEAEQLQPVRRRVALKLIRSGFNSSRIAARFESERQLLALMDHPNIARILDAGTTADGRPYFVMELVEGIPLKAFCDRHRLTVKRRLELFISLCRAVQHAHQKGVIHRDLKPSNVLVGLQDGQPHLKIIDFGIAKALAPELADTRSHTRDGAVLGTPAYMSPEQAVTGALDIDTRSDLYSLGVMLYELLAGGPPLDPESVGLHAFLLRLADPHLEFPPPSARLQGPEGERAAWLCQTSAATLKNELAGDLDWVVMKAVSKERDRRYATAEALGLELQRFLDNEPILARPPSFSYRAGKVLRRHRPLMGAAAVAAVALTVGVAGVVTGLIQADQGRKEAEQQAVKAMAAETEANIRLRSALLAQARTLSRTRVPGQRFESLELLVQAASLQPGEDLQDEAFSVLPLTDVRPRLRWSKPGSDATTLAFDGDLARYGLALRGGGIEIRRSGTQELLHTIPALGGEVWGLRFSRDARFLAAKYDPSPGGGEAALRVWDTASWELKHELPGSVTGVAFAFSPDGETLFRVSGASRLTALDLGAGGTRFTADLPGLPHDLQASPDGRVLALAYRDPPGLELRDAGSGSRLRFLPSPDALYGVAWSAGGDMLAAAGADGTVPIWEADSGRVMRSLRGHQAEVVRVEFHPHYPLLLSYGWDETTRLWDASSGNQWLALPQQGHGFSADGARLAASGGEGYWIWEVHHRDYYWEWAGHRGKGPRCFDISPDGRIVASGGLDGVLLWKEAVSQPILRLPAGDVRAVLFGRDGSRLVTCGEKGLLEWQLPADPGGGVPKPVPMARGNCLYASMDADRRRLVSVIPARGVILQDLEGGEEVRRLSYFPGMASPSLAPAARRLAFGNWRGNRTLVLEQGGRIVAELLPGETSVAVGFSPDGRLLVTGTAREYRIWETEGWREIRRVPRPLRFSNLPGVSAYSADGRWLALVMDQNRIDLMPADGARRLVSLKLPDPRLISQIRFSPDGRRLLAASSVNRIHVWELSRMVAELERLGLGVGSDF
jgi:serine/threonine protein kinase/WD40 repeat protein